MNSSFRTAAACLLPDKIKVVTGPGRIKNLAVHSEVIVNKIVYLVLLFGLLVFGGVSHVAADTAPLSLAISFEQALNRDDGAAMSALFADDAVLINGIGGAAVIGREAIQDVLAAQNRPERSFDIVWANMSGNKLTLMVDISDRGFAWGRQTLELIVEDGLIQSYEPVAFRFLF
jgi:hypothetical protein